MIANTLSGVGGGHLAAALRAVGDFGRDLKTAIETARRIENRMHAGRPLNENDDLRRIAEDAGFLRRAR